MYSYEFKEGAIPWDTSLNLELEKSIEDYEKEKKRVSRGEFEATKRARKMLKKISNLCILRRQELLEQHEEFKNNQSLER